MKNPFEMMVLLTRLRDFTLNRKILNQSDMNDENNELMVEDCKRSLEEVQKISMLGSSEKCRKKR